ncbi:VCBS repeat-containing protein [Streptomyces sp. ME01-24h]|nr:VCBS repeat-containing protein [Streptomyces sp. ME19-03-3]MDX3354913.1 VCBS repeat-containing protein [Streptomyces sp. ME01-24h]
MTSRTTRRRLAAAVTAVLALTAGAGLTAPVAIAAAGDTAVTAGAEQDSVIRIPAGSTLYGAGSTGFLTAAKDASGTYRYRWTRLADGVTTDLAGRAYGSASDTILVEEGDVYVLYDMAGGGEPVRIARTALNSSHEFYRVLGSTLLMRAVNTAGDAELHLVSVENGELIDRKVTGLPASATGLLADSDSPQGTALLRYRTPTGAGISLVSLASGTVLESRELPESASLTDIAASETHIAWADSTRYKGAALSIALRGSGDVQRTEVGGAGLSVDLLDDWMLSARMDGGTATSPDAQIALTARSLKTGTTVKLLDYAKTTFPTPDGALLARGGTLEHGEGLYRIALGDDGTPVATLVASTGEPTALALQGVTIPNVIDLDKDLRGVLLGANVSRNSVSLELELTHVASQRRLTANGQSVGSGGQVAPATVGVLWDGNLVARAGEWTSYVAAPNGAYTYRMKVTPLNGIGPAVETTGTFTVVRSPRPHDFSNNGTPDLLGVDSAGRLTRYDTTLDPFPGVLWTGRSVIGTGWNIYDRLVAPGNLGGSAHGDVLARDRSGGLWLYEGTGAPDKPLGPRRQVGYGWGIYNKITAGSDVNSDGRPDLLATDKSGVLWLYKGTGNANAPLSPRVKAGTGGWGIYNQITAPGDLAGLKAGDLLARDSAGVLWLYLGKGDGTFAPRTKVGGGWNAYTHLVGVGEFWRVGRPDLIAYQPGRSPFYYKGSGNWRAPLQPRQETFNSLSLTPGESTQLF